METLIKIFNRVSAFPFTIIYTDPYTQAVYKHVIVSREFIPSHSTQVFKSDKGDYFVDDLPSTLLLVNSEPINFKIDDTSIAIGYNETDCTCPVRHNLFAFGHVNTCEYKKIV